VEPNATPLLSAQAVEKRFGALTVLDGVTFSVGAHDAVGIVGPNGAGKTTLLNVLAGSLRPEAGTVQFNGVDVTQALPERRAILGIGRAHQVPRPFGDMTVFENVLVGAMTGGGLKRAKAYDVSLRVLDDCGLLAFSNRRAESLGLLHRKRLELARALATNPSIVLLDEIGAGLTDEEAQQLVVTIKGIRAQGVAIVWIEHIVHILVQVVERLVCMDAGKVIADGDPDAVMRDAAVIDAYLGSGVV
jgi:branched-chain amino acid transport system ATP-binding protein